VEPIDLDDELAMRYSHRPRLSSIRSLLDACPDRRQLVHSDLLHHDVLVAEEADVVTAMFSWKCATWGDAIYDFAWCTFCGRWHEGIGSLDLWDQVVPERPPGSRFLTRLR